MRANLTGQKSEIADTTSSLFLTRLYSSLRKTSVERPSWELRLWLPEPVLQLVRLLRMPTTASRISDGGPTLRVKKPLPRSLDGWEEPELPEGKRKSGGSLESSLVSSSSGWASDSVSA